MKRENSYLDISFSPDIAGGKKLLTRICERGLRLFREKLAKDCQTFVGNLSVALFATTIFIGGSYLFFIQLAEYGW